MSCKPYPYCMALHVLWQEYTYMFPYACPPFYQIGRLLRKVLQDRTKMILTAPTWQSQQRWASLLLPNSTGLVRQVTPSHQSKKIKASCMTGFRQQLKRKEVLERASDLVINTRRKSTQKSCKSARKKWSGWCSKQQADPFWYPLKYILNFLANFFDSRLSYRAIHFHGLALSLFYINDFLVPTGWST